MPDYHKMYLRLAGAQADAIDALRDTINNLVSAMQDAEQIMLESVEPDVIVFQKRDEEKK